MSNFKDLLIGIPKQSGNIQRQDPDIDPSLDQSSNESQRPNITVPSPAEPQPGQTPEIPEQAGNIESQDPNVGFPRDANVQQQAPDVSRERNIPSLVREVNIPFVENRGNIVSESIDGVSTEPRSLEVSQNPLSDPTELKSSDQETPETDPRVQEVPRRNQIVPQDHDLELAVQEGNIQVQSVDDIQYQPPDNFRDDDNFQVDISDQEIERESQRVNIPEQRIISPQDPGVSETIPSDNTQDPDGVRESENSGSLSTIDDLDIQERSESRLDEQNQQARDQEFEKFDLGGRFQEPFVTVRPDSTRADIPAGTPAIPGRAAADDQQRLGTFLASPKGILFSAEEATKQTQNTRRLTRFYDPAAIRNSAPTWLVSDTRHVDASEGILGNIVNGIGGLTEAISDIGNVPKSSKWEDEIRDLTDGEGYLVNQTPDLGGPGNIPNRITGAEYRQRAQTILANQVQSLRPDFFSRLPDGLQKFQAEQQAILDGERNQFIGMRTRSGSQIAFNRLGIQERPSQELFDAYNPIRTYQVFLDNEYDGGQQSPLLERTRREAEARDAKSYGNVDAQENAVSPFHPAVQGEPPEDAPRDETFQGDETYRVVYRRKSSGETSYGYPNHSVSEKDEDLVNLTGIEDVSSDDDPDVLTNDQGEEFQDIIPLRFYDIVNNKRIAFRSYVSGISVSNSVNWNSTQYIGRPEQYHIYGGNSRQLSFSFTAFAGSQKELESQWTKLNYLQSLVYPSNFSTLEGGGAYMIAPFLRLTIGNLYRKHPGFIQSLDFTMPDDSPWETAAGRQLPKQVEISTTYTLIEREFPNAGDKYFDADIIPDESL